MTMYLERQNVPVCQAIRDLQREEDQYQSGTTEHTEAWAGYKDADDKTVDGPLHLQWESTRNQVGGRKCLNFIIADQSIALA